MANIKFLENMTRSDTDKKRCSRCGELKLPSEFNKNRNKYDGLRPECRKCQKETSIGYYELRGGRDKKQDYQVKNREKIMSANKKYSGAGLSKYNPEKSPARIAVSRAVESGKLIKPEKCERCGKTGKIEAHHKNGYALEHRLDIDWLCSYCHRMADHPIYYKKLEELHV